MTTNAFEKRAALLKQKRMELGLTQQQVADKADIGIRTYGDLERGYRPGRKPVDVRPDTLARISKVLCIELRALLPPAEENWAPSGTQLTFAECRSDFMRWESVGDHDSVEIDTLAIDLADGWENIVAAINSCHANTITFRIMILGGDVTVDDQDVRSVLTDKWIPAARNSLAYIRNELARFKTNKKNISIQIKTYNRVPTIHGIRARKNGKTRWWIGECRLVDGDLSIYEWGQDDFLVLDGSKALQHARVKAYDRLFSEYWASENAFEIDVVSMVSPGKS